jgi:Resolvase, N terminal domain
MLDGTSRSHRPAADPHRTWRRRRPDLPRRGTHRQQPAPAGLDQALAAVRSGDTLVVPKLDRLARSVPDIGDSLVARGVILSLGGTVYDPADPMGKMFFNILAAFAEFEVDLLRMRTREGMAIAKAGCR